MDNTSPSPPKRPRTIEFLTSQLGKPVRYFPFNKKSSENDTQQEKLGKIERISTINSQHVVSSSQMPVIPFSSTMKFVPNKEANISNKMQKLKLKSPDGRDLGEINVQLLPQKGDGIGGKTIMLQKHSLFGKLDKPSAVSILKPIEKINQPKINGTVSIVQTIATPVSFVNAGSNCVSVNSIRSINSVRETGSSRPVWNVTHKVEPQMGVPTILRHHEVPKYSSATFGSKVVFLNVDKQTGVNTVKSINKEAKSLVSNQKIIVVHAENYPDSTEGNRNNGLGAGTELRRVSLSKDDANTEFASSTSNLRTIPNVFWNPSKFPEFTSKLNSQKSKIIEGEILKNSGNITGDKQMLIVAQAQDSASKSGALAISTLNKKQKPKLNSWTILKTSGKKLENGRQSSCEGEGGKESPKSSVELSRISQAVQNVTVYNPSSENTQNVTSTTNTTLHSVLRKQSDRNAVANVQNGNLEETSNDQNRRENIMVIVHGDMNTLKDSENKNLEASDESNNKTNSMEVDTSTEVNAVLMREENGPEKITAVSNQVSILKQSHKASKGNATSSTPGTLSPKQQDLDIIQKALSSCTDQTLRDKALKALADCGIGVKRDVPVPAKVSVSDSATQTKVFCLLESDLLLECTESSPVLNKLNVVNRSEKSPRNTCEALPLDENYIYDFALDFSSEFENLLPDELRNEVNQVKHVFSKPNTFTSQVATQIQKDFQAATTVDSNGMMGIHRAVLSGSVKEVQRQLIVLQAVKKSIEIPTGNGETSLELAVLHDVDPRIVKALLAAGAKPAFPIKLHESALIIASRTSSDLLTELIKYTTPSSLLDFMDSEGFAPLHYCAQLGNMQGVKSLVSAGASVNLKDAKSGRTALFHALEGRNIEMAWYLVENGASPNITNFAGQSAAALVDEYRHNSLAEKLNQAVR